ncbi:MAG: hypothetical protein V1688_00870 [bacterium]
MKYIDLINKIKEPIFSLQDLRLLGLKVFPYQISDWAKKGYIIPLKNGLYAFADKKNVLAGEHIAFSLYQPSYISMERALSFYGLIPEMVYSHTCVTAKTTRTFENIFGVFSYRHIKREMFFGYLELTKNNQPYLIAEPEKALIDFLYLNRNKIKTKADIDEMRFNSDELKKIDRQKIKRYNTAICNSRVDEILKMLF